MPVALDLGGESATLTRGRQCGTDPFNRRCFLLAIVEPTGDVESEFTVITSEWLLAWQTCRHIALSKSSVLTLFLQLAKAKTTHCNSQSEASAIGFN